MPTLLQHQSCTDQPLAVREASHHNSEKREYCLYVAIAERSVRLDSRLDAQASLRPVGNIEEGIVHLTSGVPISSVQ